MRANELKVGAILSYISIFLNVIIGLVYSPVMLRIMGQSEYGLYSLTISIVGYLIILDFGFGSAGVRYIAQYRALNKKDEEYALNGMFLLLYTFIGLLAAGIGAILFLNVENMFSSTMSQMEMEKIKVMILLLVFNLSISFPFSVFTSIITAYEKFIFSKVVNIARILFNPCIMLPLLFLGYRSVTMAVVTTLLNLLCIAINCWYCVKKLKVKFIFKKFDFTILQEILKYSFWIFVAMIVERIYWSSDQFILGVVSGSVMVAIYSVASLFVNYYISLSTAMTSVLLPKLTKMVANNSSVTEISDLFIKTGRLQYIILSFILSGFVLFGKPFITLWAGDGYDSAYFITIIIMVPLTASLIQTLGITILQAKNMMAFRSIVYLIIAILNISISIFLGKIWGGIGCAIGTATAMITGNIIAMNIYYYKKVQLDIPKFWKEISMMSVPVVISLMFGTAMNFLIDGNSIITILIKSIFFTLIFIISMWYISLNKYEKNLFLLPIRNFKSVGAKFHV